MLGQFIPRAILFITILLSSNPAFAKMVSVNADMINLRNGPGKNYKVIWELGRGYPLKVIKSQGNWYKVKDYEDDTGWVYKKLVNRKAHLVVKQKTINLRSGPSKKYRIIRQAKKGVVFETLVRKKGWVKVRHAEENITGWIKRSLLWGW